MKHVAVALLLAASVGAADSARAKTRTGAPPDARQELVSPDRRLVATFTVGDELRYALAVDGRTVLTPAPLSLTLADGRVFGRGRLRGVERRDVDETIPTPHGKRSRVRNRASELGLVFSDGATLRARVYDDGLALRWETALPGRIRVRDEGFAIAFPFETRAHFLSGSGPHHNYEGLWRHEPISALGAWDKEAVQLASLPLVVDLPGGARLALLQADLDDYPAMYMRYNAGLPGQMRSVFPRRALAEAPGGWQGFDLRVTSVADDIAETKGTRSFPWRAVVLARREADLLVNDMVERLGAPPAPGADFSWVEPGKVVWDFWANWNLEGVDFVAGRNDATFRYYIDFAARHGFRYVNVDWLWSDPQDLFATNPDVNLPALIEYARGKGVGIFVWCLAQTLERQLEPAMDRFQKWGVAGLKIDFFDRDDQRMVALYRRFAEEAAKRRMLVLFHGATAPWGLSRTLPNVMAYEAVRGLEYDKFDQQGSPPPNEVTIPYTRMLAGAMDFTPGSMRAFNKADWRTINDLPFSQGTLARQLAMYVMYETPLPMLSDMPTAYEGEPHALEFLRAVPTTWEESLGLDGTIGEWALIARREKGEWWVAAMTDWSQRTVEAPTAFLEPGPWEAVLWTDGANADKVGTDYRRTTASVTAGEPLRLELAPGGGAVVRLRRSK